MEKLTTQLSEDERDELGPQDIYAKVTGNDKNGTAEMYGLLLNGIALNWLSVKRGKHFVCYFMLLSRDGSRSSSSCSCYCCMMDQVYFYFLLFMLNFVRLLSWI
jgi:hypothetical protein